MFDNGIDLIKKAQKGDKETLWKLISENNRSNLEYSKKIFWKRLRIRRFISNWLCWLYQIYSKI